MPFPCEFPYLFLPTRPPNCKKQLTLNFFFSFRERPPTFRMATRMSVRKENIPYFLMSMRNGSIQVHSPPRKKWKC